LRKIIYPLTKKDEKMKLYETHKTKTKKKRVMGCVVTRMWMVNVKIQLKRNFSEIEIDESRETLWATGWKIKTRFPDN
jgi:hypothetical protein